MRVFVYWNLHRKVWSVKALEGAERGRVVAHRLDVALTACQFRVSEAGRQRVLREQRKNVHAGVVGEWADARPSDDLSGDAVTYNPYKAPTFTRRADGAPVRSAEAVDMVGRNVVARGAL